MSLPFLLSVPNFLRKFAWNLMDDLKTFATTAKGFGTGNFRLFPGLESFDAKSAERLQDLLISIIRCSCCGAMGKCLLLLDDGTRRSPLVMAGC